MPRGGYSFRILSPGPSEFFHKTPLPPEMVLAVECPTRPKALELKKKLLASGKVHRLFLEKKNPLRVMWVMSHSTLQKFLKSPDSAELSEQIRVGLKGYFRKGNWDLKGSGTQWFRWGRRTQVMGVLNVTPDSFSDGGRYLDPAVAADQALQMQEAGVDWIDIGGESTRPGAKAVSSQEEKRRILPVIQACAKSLRIPVSVDTYKAEVARAAVGEGAQMINDIGALGLDPRMGKTAARLKVPVILMHMRGRPRTMQQKPVYRDVVGEVLAFFRQRIAYARQCGISEDRLLIDPGFGFGKTPWHNIELTRRLWEFKVLDRPLVFGPSRKSTLGFLLGGAPPEKRVEATGAAVTAAILNGADWVRVHDVQSMAPVVKIADAIRYDRGLAKP